MWELMQPRRIKIGWLVAVFFLELVSDLAARA